MSVAYFMNLLRSRSRLPRTGLVARYEYKRTNFLNSTRDGSSTLWTRGGVTVATGTTTAIMANSTGQKTIRQNIAAFGDNAVVHVRGRLKNAGYNFCGYQLKSRTGVGFPTVVFNLTTGAVTSNTGAWTVRETIVLGGGEIEVYATCSVGAGSTVPDFSLFFSADGTTAGFTGDGVGGVTWSQLRVGFADLPHEDQTDGQRLTDVSVTKNLVANSDGVGGTTSTLPSGWNFGHDTGVNSTITAVRASTVVPGAFEYDVTVNNTDVVNRTARVYFAPLPYIEAAPSESFGWSVYLAAPTVFGISANVYNYSLTPAFLGNAAGGVYNTTPTLTRYGVVRTLNNDANTRAVRPIIEFSVPAGGSRSFTFCAPQLERGGVVTEYQRSPLHAQLGGTVASDITDPTWGPLGLTHDGADDYEVVFGYPASTGVDTYTFRVPAATANFQTIYNRGAQLAGGTGPFVWLYRDPNTNTGNLRLQAADGTANLSPTLLLNAEMTAGDVVTVVMNYAAKTARVYVKGVFVREAVYATANPLSVPGAGTAYLAAYQGTNHRRAGTESVFVHHARGLTDAEVAQLYRFLKREHAARPLPQVI